MSTLPESLPESLPDFCVGLIDDAAIFPPGNTPLEEAMAAHLTRRTQPHAELVGPFALRDTDLPEVADFDAPLALIVTGGAGQVAGPLALAARHGLQVAQVEIALRDPDDLAGNARRVVAAVDAARADGVLDDEVPVYVELPHADSVSPGTTSGGWLAAADELAAMELRLKFRTGGPDPDDVPAAHTLARWIDAALDRETPFKCTAGLHHALRHTTDGVTEHGFLNVLLATRAAFDGADGDEVAAILDDPAPALPEHAELARARRWFASFGSCSIEEPLDDLRGLGLIG